MLWYAAYGSNLDRTRFLHYLSGGAAPGSRRVLEGARDPSPPRDERAFTFAGTMFFGWESPTWGGGISFVDVASTSSTAERTDDVVLARAYLLTEEQFADVATQEMHRDLAAAAPLDLAPVLEHRRHTLGPGRYETLHHLGELDGHPVLTFTAEHRHAVEPNQPSAGYLRLLGRGLRDTHGLSTTEVSSHLLTRPGIGDWTTDTLVDLLGQDSGT